MLLHVVNSGRLPHLGRAGGSPVCHSSAAPPKWEAPVNSIRDTSCIAGSRGSTDSQQAGELAKGANTVDDVPDRPVVYVEVTEMAPPRSRLQEVHIHDLPPSYSGV